MHIHISREICTYIYIERERVRAEERAKDREREIHVVPLGLLAGEDHSGNQQALLLRRRSTVVPGMFFWRLVGPWLVLGPSHMSLLVGPYQEPT